MTSGATHQGQRTLKPPSSPAEPQPLPTPQPVPTPDEPSEDQTEEAVSQLNESLKSCHKVVSDYRAALLNKQAPDKKPPRGG